MDLLYEHQIQNTLAYTQATLKKMFGFWVTIADDMQFMDRVMLDRLPLEDKNVNNVCLYVVDIFGTCLFSVYEVLRDLMMLIFRGQLLSWYDHLTLIRIHINRLFCKGFSNCPYRPCLIWIHVWFANIHYWRSWNYEPNQLLLICSGTSAFYRTFEYRYI